MSSTGEVLGTQTPCRPRIALIHAVKVAMLPIEHAFLEHWPDAEIVHLLDDSLSPDRAECESLAPGLIARINSLADYAVLIDSTAILFTCSAFGEAIELASARLSIPVLKPNVSMFEAAIEAGHKVGMLATFGPSVESMEHEFYELARQRGITASITTMLVPEAMKALKSGDEETHNALLAERASDLHGCDCIMLAHFSTSRALNAVQAKAKCPVLTSPESAVRKLKSLIAR